MYVKVKQLRHQGMRRRERDLLTDKGTIGRLTGFVIEGHPVLHLFEWGPQEVAMNDLYFPLIKPWIIGIRDMRMLVSGWQQISSDHGDASMMLQEWAIEVLTDRAPITDGILHGPRRRAVL